MRADWWRAFGDPVLTELVEQALAANVDIEIATARVEEARATEALSRAQLLPQIGGTIPETQGQTLSPFGLPSRAVGAQPSLSASYDLDLFGRLRLASRATRAQLLASEGARDTVRLATIASTASGYITLRALDQRLAIARETLASREDAQRIARRRFETGYSSRLEYRQAQAEYNATAQLVPAAELAISRQENALSLLTGRAPGTIRRGLALDHLAPPPIPDGLPADLLRRRPDLYQAEQTLVAADLSLDSQRAAMLPNVSLTGSVGLVLSTALANPVGVFSLGGSILAPIFDGGRLRAQERRGNSATGSGRVRLSAHSVDRIPRGRRRACRSSPHPAAGRRPSRSRPRPRAAPCRTHPTAIAPDTPHIWSNSMHNVVFSLRNWRWSRREPTG